MPYQARGQKSREMLEQKLFWSIALVCFETSPESFEQFWNFQINRKSDFISIGYIQVPVRKFWHIFKKCAENLYSSSEFYTDSENRYEIFLRFLIFSYSFAIEGDHKHTRHPVHTMCGMRHDVYSVDCGILQTNTMHDMVNSIISRAPCSAS